jgi:DHA2 family multidrug resistance protein-like MFS transporter
MGVLGDRIGRRRLLLIGAAAFGCASVLAAFAPSVEALIVARALLGLAAATLAPSTLSLLRSMFLDPKQRTFAIGVWIASFSAGGAIGPLIGGVLLQFFWWGSVFLINVPVMVLLLAMGPRLLPEFRDPQAGRPDIVSAALCIATVLAVIYGVKRIAGHRADRVAAATIVAGLLIGALFLRRQRRLAEPFIDLGLFRRVTFSAALAVNIFGFFVAFGTFLLIAQYLQLVIGLSPARCGPVVRSVRDSLCRGRDADATDGEPSETAACDRDGIRDRCAGLRPAHANGHGPRCGRRGDRLRRVLPGTCPGLYPRL